MDKQFWMRGVASIGRILDRELSASLVGRREEHAEAMYEFIGGLEFFAVALGAVLSADDLIEAAQANRGRATVGGSIRAHKAANRERTARWCREDGYEFPPLDTAQK